MDNNEILDHLESEPAAPVFSTDWPPVLLVLGVLLLAAFFSLMFYGATIFGLGKAMGVDIMGMMQSLDGNSILYDRQIARLAQGLSHLFLFVIPSFFALRFYEKNRRKMGNTRFSWASDIGWNRFPTVTWLGIGCVLLLISLPIVHYSYGINKALPLPDWMRNSESDISNALKGFLKMESPVEMLVNVLIVAVLPAIGEELMFRGVLQKQCMRRMDAWPAILLSAAVFSAIHFQFEGFLPRWILGVVLGWVFWKSRNLWVPIIVHLLNNGLQVVGYYYYGGENSAFDVDEQLDVPMWAALISLVAVLALFHFFEEKKERKA